MSTTCTVVIRLFSREYMNFKALKRYMDGKKEVTTVCVKKC